jgi:hypothetical protein
MPAPARAPKNGTLVGATPALLLAELADLEAELAAEDEAEATDLEPLEAALLTAALAEPAALEETDETEALAPADLEGFMLMEVMDWAAARPAKRRVIEKRILVLMCCCWSERGNLCTRWRLESDQKMKLRHLQSVGDLSDGLRGC